MDTFSEVKEIIMDLLGKDESIITMDTRFRYELEADSLDIVELIMAAEDRFGLDEIPNEAVQKINTVADAVAYIDAHR
jgi:acyl carrier protein